MEEYVQPTAEAFGYVFSLFPQEIGGMGHADPGAIRTDTSQVLARIGRHLGAVIISFDCGVDGGQISTESGSIRYRLSEAPETVLTTVSANWQSLVGFC